jgi:predicted acylesterase/phospholipase RssA
MDSSTSPSNPTLEYCDLVMKGGITSGVVYPLAITELSRRYLFRNIGGTSAGAVAAVVSAAAEFGRRSGNPQAYALLAAIPGNLGTNHLLLRLFQPSTATARIFRVALAVLKAESIPARIFAALWALLYQFWGWTLLGILLGAAVPVVLFLICAGPVAVYAVLGLLWIVVIGATMVLIGAGIDALEATVKNGFGFCSGFDRQSKGGPPLTNWLHEQIQLAAGKDLATPLTFGDLSKAPAMPGESLTGPAINLQVVTTNLTLGRPFTIPFESYAFYFDENQFKELFPESVVRQMIEKSPSKPNETVTSRKGDRLHRLPQGADLPVVVAARMSLSFPVLLSAVPLYLPDYPHKTRADETEMTDLEESRPAIHVNADLCWFSDGGICSNFPMHFFDSPLPRWPTFGIDLQPDRSQNEKSNEQLVWFPPRPGSGSQLLLNDFDQGSSWERLCGFLGAILNTMQDWRDNLQATAAGYRDRIVHIKLRPDEGGLNLNMPRSVIDNLSDRGRIAGQKILKQFDFSSHIYARYRITMCALEKYLNDLNHSWTIPLPQDTEGQDYIRGTKVPPHYQPRSQSLRQLMLAALTQLVNLSQSWQSARGNQSFSKDGAPRPEPILRNQPKF